MDEKLHHIANYGYDYLSKLKYPLNYVTKRSPGSLGSNMLSLSLGHRRFPSGKQCTIIFDRVHILHDDNLAMSQRMLYTRRILGHWKWHMVFSSNKWHRCKFYCIKYINSWVQNFSSSITNTLGILQWGTKPSTSPLSLNILTWWLRDCSHAWIISNI